jgi:hypothetical protein
MRINLLHIIFLEACLIATTTHARDLTLNNAPAQVYFSPRGGCTEAVVEALIKARSEVFVQAYSFTSK